MTFARFFPERDLGDTFVFGGAYYEGDAGYALPFDSLPYRYARPVSDASAGSWLPSSGIDLFDMLDEEEPADADYIYATAPSVCEVALGPVQDPQSSSGHKVSFRVPDGFVPFGALTVSLRQGASTEIASWTVPSPVAGTTYSYTLSGAQADAITDYTDLRLRFTVD